MFDGTSYALALQNYNNVMQMIEYNKEMIKNVGKGNVTPATVSWAANWYKQCGGRTIELPDFFPKPNLSICADEKQTVDIGVKWYKNEFLVLGKDNPAEVKKKIEQAKEDSVKIRAYALTQSVRTLSRGKEDKKLIDNLQGGLNSATDQIAVAKVQTQVMIDMLGELQKVNENQSLIIHIMAVKP